jgi:hypothetical protein
MDAIAAPSLMLMLMLMLVPWSMNRLAKSGRCRNALPRRLPSPVYKPTDHPIDA